MSTLEEIDKLFKEAQETVMNGDPEKTRIVLWPKIKEAIATYTDLSREKRGRLTRLIPEYLEQPRFLQSGEKTQIRSINELIARLQSPEEYPPLWHAW